MKKTVFPFILMLVVAFPLAAQSKSGTSPMGSLHIAKQFLPPFFIIEGNPTFKDVGNNSAIDANEQCEIVLTVTNKGRGPAQGLKAVMDVTGDIDGLHWTASNAISDIKVGETRKVSFPISTDMNTVNGQVKVMVKITEPHALGTPPQYLVLETREFEAPLVKCTDYALEGDGGELTLGKPFVLNMGIQNVRRGRATDVKVKVILPNNVISANDGTSTFHYSYAVMEPGQSKELNMPMFANLAYTKKDIPVQVSISEHYGRFAIDTTIHLQLGAFTIDTNKVIAKPKPDIIIDPFILTSDVDVSIPTNATQNSNLFVLIIANQRYNNEQEVSTAINDGRIMEQYCTQTLGVPAGQVRRYENRTYTEMKGDIERFAHTMQLNNNPRAKFMVFYFGHGIADPNRQITDSYLLPIDASTQRELSGQAISRNWMMKQFSTAQPRQLVVFLESCFSGTSNTDALLAYAENASGTRLQDKSRSFGGNILVITASSGSETANAYPAQHHNIFTYEFLKILQKTKGDIPLGELFDRVKLNTAKTADRIYYGNRQQTPSVITSEELKDQWRTWSLK